MFRRLVQGGDQAIGITRVLVSNAVKTSRERRAYVMKISEGLDVSRRGTGTASGRVSHKFADPNWTTKSNRSPINEPSTSSGNTGMGRGKTREYTGSMGEALEKDKAKLYRLVFQSPRTRNLQAIRERMRQMEQAYPPSMHLYNVFLKSMIWMNDKEGIRAILDKVKQAGLAFNLITFNLMIGYYRDQDCAREAERLLWVMRKADISPNLYTFTTLISAFSHVNLHKCQEYWEQAHSLGADIYAYNAIIGAHVQHGDLATADRLVEELRAAGLTANFVTYKILLEGLTKALRLDDAMRLYEQLLSQCSELRIGDYSEVARCFWEAGGRLEAVRVYRDMERIFGHMDYHGVVNSLGMALLSKGNDKEAENIFLRYIPSHAKKYEYALRRIVRMIEGGNGSEVPALLGRIKEVLAELESSKEAQEGATKREQEVSGSEDAK